MLTDESKITQIMKNILRILSIRIRLPLAMLVITGAVCCITVTLTRCNRTKNAQNPNRYTFTERDISYENNIAGITLAGTLTIPTKRCQIPGVILVGNGICDRDFTVGEHRLFRVIAHHLAQCGIAVLRSDGRGVGQSGGKPWPEYTKEDLASDLRSAFKYLNQQTWIDSNRIGIVGHSEGGTVASIVTANSSKVAFLVLLGSPGLPGNEILSAQISHVAPTLGVEKSLADRYAKLIAQVGKTLRLYSDDNVVSRKLEQSFDAFNENITANDRESLRRSGYSVSDNSRDFAAGIQLPWMKDFLTFDPTTVLAQIRCPVLSLIGEKDLQVLARENNPVIRTALSSSGNRDYIVSELKGLNHLLQTAHTGSPSEYVQINEPIASHALKTISDWILQRAR
jgi:pimeloyl-ACP methyl ester carboxylesterase